MTVFFDIPLGRNELARLFRGVGAEIGVERGVYSKTICTQSPGVTLYCVDPWLAYKGYRDHVSQEKLDGFYLETTARLHPYHCIIIAKTSEDALDDLPELDFVYIDANHDEAHVRHDIARWADKVKSGGIVAGHDYIRRKGQGHLYAVKDVVNEYVETFNVPELQVWRGDHSPSWMFIKP